MHPRMTLALSALIGPALLLGPSAVATADGFSPFPGNGACSGTAVDALRACRHEAEDDFWIETGKCRNIADPDERTACLAEADAARAEKLRECEAQFLARGELCRRLGEDPYDPAIDPEDFLDPDEAAADPNPHFPLAPGARWVYESEDAAIEVTVLEETVEILGVECFAVRDVVREDGEVIEDTIDWYAVDEDKNVWYFGEIAQNFEDGQLVDVEGSWRAGDDRARPGILMIAEPEVAGVYRQEFLLGEAEDIGEVLSLDGDEDAPAASCEGRCVVTADTTPLEPGHLEHKYYAPGVGLILEIDPATGERVELVEYELPQALRPAGAGEGGVRDGIDLSVDPNPFESDVAIRFTLGSSSLVSAEVFDAAGRSVRVLASEAEARPGPHVLGWDGRDDAGHALTAGVYFVRVRAGGMTETRSLVLAASGGGR